MKKNLTLESSDPSIASQAKTSSFKTYTGVATAILVGMASIPSISAQDEDDEDVFELSPFEVNSTEDRGYEAQNTLSGTRLNTSTKDIGVTMTILTDQLMDDLAVNGTNDLIEFTPGSEKETTQGGEGASTIYWGDNTRIRGVRVENMVRNQFVTNITGDGYNAGRFEFSRGGNSILFGIGNPAGLVNRYTNDATFSNTNRYRFQVDDEGGMRHELNLNRVLIENKLALRVALLHEEGENWIKPLFSDQDRAYAAITFNPTEKLSFKVRAEKFDWQRSIPSYGIHQDAVTPYADAAAAAGNTLEEHAINRNHWAWLAPGSVGSEFNDWGYGGANTLVFVNDEANPNGAPRNWINKAISAPLQVAGGKNASLPTDMVARDFNIFGNSNIQEFDGHNLQAVAQWKINDHFDLEIAANTESIEYDFYVNWGANTLWADGSATLGDGATPNPSAGKFFVRNDTQWRYQQQRDLDNLRATGSFNWDFAEESDSLGWLGEHQVAVLLETAISENRWDSRWLANTTPGTTPVPNINGAFPESPRNGWNGSNLVKIINYVDLETQTIYGPTDPRDYQAYANQFEGVNAEWVPSFNAIAPAANKETIDSFMGVIQSRFLDNRLVTTFGWRADSILSESVPYDPNDPDPDSFKWQLDGAPAGWSKLAADAPLEAAPKVEPDTISRGFNYHMLKEVGALSYLTLYAHESTTFGSNSVGVLPNKERKPNTTGETLNYGVKFGAFNNKISGVFTIFDVSLNDEGAIGLQWSDLDLLGQAAGINDFEALDPSTTRDTRDLVSKGWEFQINANLTPNWRMMVSIDHFATEFENVAPTTGSIFDEYTDIFLEDPDRIVSEDGNGEVETAQQVYDEIYFAYLEKKAEEGSRSLNERRNKVVFVTSYDFKEGATKGLGIGADVIWQDKAATGFALRQEEDGWVPDAAKPFFSDDIIRVGAHVRYSKKIMDNRLDWTIQLNVKNIGGTDPYVVRDGAIESDPNTAIPWYTNRGEPTRYTLTNTFKF